MLGQADAALSRFAGRERHAYQGGGKRPQALIAGESQLHPLGYGMVNGAVVEERTNVKVLGHILDNKLSLHAHADYMLGRMRQAGGEVTTEMHGSGFGLPFMTEQFTVRIEGKALAGVEILTSRAGGFELFMTKLNKIEHEIARALLGLPRDVVVGSAALRVAMARLACLPDTHIAQEALRGAECVGALTTWWQDSRRVFRYVLGVQHEIWEFGDLSEAGRWSQKQTSDSSVVSATCPDASSPC